MYAGFPKLPVTEAQPVIDVEKEKEDENGCVMRTEFSVPKSVALTFPAVCALLYCARGATSNKNIFGEIIGLQIGDHVTITDLRPKPFLDDDDAADARNPLTAEEKEERVRHRDDVKAFEEIYKEENLDRNVIGPLIVCSARFNPYSKHTMRTLREKHNESLPAVLLTYDPFRTSLLGRPCIRAFTPTEAYYKYADLEAKDRGLQRRRGVAGYAKESGITKLGALHEIPVQLEVDAFHKLNLQHVECPPVADSFQAIEGKAVGNYIEALLSSIRKNAEMLRTNLDKEGKMKDNNNAPVGQSVETILLMKHLREQTDHLDALCDSALLYSSLLRDM